MDKLMKLADHFFNSSPNDREKVLWNRKPRDQKEKIALSLYMKYRNSKEKNWCHLPPELKLKCIKKMDFDSKLKLRTTARAERDLVDSQKMHFSKVLFDNRDRGFSDIKTVFNREDRYGRVTVEYPYRPIRIASTPSEESSSSSHDYVSDRPLFEDKQLNIYNKNMYFSAIHYLAYVLKIGKIDSFEIEETYSPGRFEKSLKVLAKSAPFHIKEFHVLAIKKSLVSFFLKNMAEGLETIFLNAEYSEHFPFDDFLNFPAFVNAKLIKIRGLECSKAVSKLAELWIKNDAPLGTKVYTSVGNIGLKSLDEFIEKFSDRIIMKSDGEVRIRSDNTSKHIFLKVIKEQYSDYVCCSIISSEQKVLVEDRIITWPKKFSGNPLDNFFHVSCWEDESNNEMDTSWAALIESCKNLNIDNLRL